MNEKGELVTWLTTNCDCWKPTGSDVVLNAFDIERLKTLKAVAEKAKAADPMRNLLVSIANATGYKESNPTNLPTYITNQMSEKDKKVKDAEEEAAKKEKDKTTTNSTNPLTRSEVLTMLKGLSDKEWLDIAPPTINKFVETAKNVDKRERFSIMEKLVANVTDKSEKEAKLLKLKDKSLDQLNEYLEFAIVNGKADPPKDDNATFLADFFGAQGVGDPQQTNNRRTGTKPATDGAPLMPSLWSADNHLSLNDDNTSTE